MKFKKVAAIFGIVVLVSGMISHIYASREVRAGNRYLPTIFGLTGVTIQTGSMKPIADIGDYVVIKLPNEDNISEGDIITFVNENVLVTHRVEEVVEKDGQAAFVTKGDANNVEDRSLVYIDEVVGVEVVVIPNLGAFFNMITSANGMIVIGIIIVGLYFMPDSSRKKKIKEA